MANGQSDTIETLVKVARELLNDSIFPPEEIAWLQERIVRLLLVQAEQINRLRKYGSHKIFCGWLIFDGNDMKKVCTCGLNSLLAPAVGEGRQEIHLQCSIHLQPLLEGQEAVNLAKGYYCGYCRAEQENALRVVQELRKALNPLSGTREFIESNLDAICNGARIALFEFPTEVDGEEQK